jgi:hypothetical protein
MPINISISAADVDEVRHALRQLLGDDQPAPATLAAAIADAVEVAEIADAPAPTPTPAKRKAGRPPKGARAVEPEAEDEIEQEIADEPEAMGLEQARETVRDALNGYVKMFGMDATQVDILKLYDIVFPDGSVTKVSDIPEGLHAKVVDGIKEMAAKNPFKRKPV